MKHSFLIAALGAALCGSAAAQVTDATVCEILKAPQSFDGKTVRIKGTVVAGLDQFVIKGEGCGQSVNAIWLAYPEGTKGKAGPAAVVVMQPASNFSGEVSAAGRSAVTLEKNKDFKQFDSLLSAPYKNGGMCLACVRNEVSATLVGRLDGAKAGIQRDKSGKITGISGFGNLNAYSARLVLASVADVAAHEIDYSKSAAITKDDSVPEAPSGNPVAGVHQVAKVFGPGNPSGEQIERAASAYGKEGEHNGVEIAFNGANEASARLEGKSAQSSPDGVIFNCIFDTARLKGDALGRALAHIGQHVADVRNPGPDTGDNLYRLEYAGWGTTVYSAVGARQKTLTIPGGYLLWNASWPQADIANSLNAAIREFLSKQALLQD